MIAPLAQQSGLDQVGSNIFQLNSTPRTQATALGEFATLFLGFQSFAVVAPLTDYGWSFQREFSQTVASYGATVVYADWYVPSETKDFKRVFEGIRRAGFSLMTMKADEAWWPDEEGEGSLDDWSGAETQDGAGEQGISEEPELEYSPELFISSVDGVVLVIENFDDAKVIAPQLRFHRLETQILGNDIWHEPTAIRQMKSTERRYLEGAMFVASMDNRAAPAQSFANAFRRRFGKDPEYAAYGYDAARLFLEGWRQGHRSRSALRDWISSLQSYSGASGKISFPNGSRTNREFLMMRIESGGRVKPY